MTQTPEQRTLAVDIFGDCPACKKPWARIVALVAGYTTSVLAYLDDATGEIMLRCPHCGATFAKYTPTPTAANVTPDPSPTLRDPCDDCWQLADGCIGCEHATGRRKRS